MVTQVQVGHFVCSITGKHEVTPDDEDRLYSSSSYQIDTKCKRCKLPIRLTIEPNHPRVFSVKRISSFDSSNP